MAAISGEVGQLLAHPHLWRARDLDASPAASQAASDRAIASGYPILDQWLSGNGWPRAGMVELLADRVGIGELRLLAPALAALSQQEQRWLTWINPPHLPYAPALAALGIAIDKVLLVHPKCHEDALWSFEQALKSGTCSAALGWFDEQRLTTKDIRRLQLAARQGGTLTVLFRPRNAAQQASLAELRLLLQPTTPAHFSPEEAADHAREQLQIEIIKRRGGWPVAPFSLSLQQPSTPLTTAELNAHIECWRIHAKSWQTTQRIPEQGMPRNSLPKPLPTVARSGHSVDQSRAHHGQTS
jgi:hypothetical protein